jgi:hypothetical protein
VLLRLLPEAITAEREAMTHAAGDQGGGIEDHFRDHHSREPVPPYGGFYELAYRDDDID